MREIHEILTDRRTLRIALDMWRRIAEDNEAEVKRLRAAIEAHREQCHKTYKVAQAWWDEDLWAVLDA